MRFLVDECSGPNVAKWLAAQGHEVFSVFDESQGISADETLLKAVSEDWIIVTNDKDFGELIFRERKSHRVVIFLCLEYERYVMKISVLLRLLARHSQRLANNFVVVSESKVRFAKV